MWFIKEFKEFAVKGNVMDMAVGVIIGGAFGKIVTSLVGDVLMPLISMATGGSSFVDLFVNLSDGKKFNTLAEAQEAGASVLAYGSFIQAVVNFLIIALCIFVAINAMKKAKERVEKRLKKDEEKKEDKKSDEVVLLEQIKDLLKKQVK